MRWLSKTAEPEHSWFAWHPVKTESYEWVWLETVIRYWQGARGGGYWIYYLKEEQK